MHWVPGSCSCDELCFVALGCSLAAQVTQVMVVHCGAQLGALLKARVETKQLERLGPRLDRQLRQGIFSWTKWSIHLAPNKKQQIEFYIVLQFYKKSSTRGFSSISMLATSGNASCLLPCFL